MWNHCFQSWWVDEMMGFTCKYDRQCCSQNMCHNSGPGWDFDTPSVDPFQWLIDGDWWGHIDTSWPLFCGSCIPANSLTFATKRAQRFFATFLKDGWFCLAYTLEVQPTKQRIWRIPDPTKGQSLVFGLPGHNRVLYLNLCVFFSGEAWWWLGMWKKNPCH